MNDKKSSLAMLARLYDEVETDKAVVSEVHQELEHMYEVTTMGKTHSQYVPGMSQTITMTIRRYSD